jgi:hypothetical protein
MSKVAKRLECAGFSGAVGRAERLDWWMFPMRTKSGAEVNATSRRSLAKAEVHTLREFRSVAAFGRKPPSENEGEECGALPRRRYAGRMESQLADGGQNKRRDAKGAEKRRETFLSLRDSAFFAPLRLVCVPVKAGSHACENKFMMTTVLTPALSSRRGRNVRCGFGMSGDGIGRTIIREPENVQRRLLLPGGDLS